MDDGQVQDGEIIEEGLTESSQASSDQATVLLSLEEMIKRTITSLDKLRSEAKTQRQMLADVFASDQTYQEHDKKVKEATKIRTGTKQQILKQPAVLLISNKIKSMNSDIKEKDMSLSDYLKEYQRMTGVNEIELENGEVREIVQTVKVIRKFTK